MEWYDRKGKPMVTARKMGSKLWIKEMSKVNRLLGDREHKVIKQEKLWWGGWLSTVWLGLDHSFVFKPSKKHRPIIFETMLFLHGASDIECNRYYTEEEAIAGHRAMKKLYNESPDKIIKAYWSLIKDRWYRFERSLSLKINQIRGVKK